MKVKEIIKKAKNGQKQILREKDMYVRGNDFLKNRQLFQEVSQLVTQGKILKEYVRQY